MPKPQQTNKLAGLFSTLFL